MLNPTSADETIDGAIRNLQQAYLSERDNAEQLQQENERLAAELNEEKRLRSELKQIAQAGIAEVSSVGAMLKDNALIDFRARAVSYCKDRAAEYAKATEGYALDDRFRLCLSSKREAYSDAATELEKLK